MRIIKTLISFFGCCLTACAMILCAVPASAQDEQDCLVVHMRDGGRVSYVLEETPVVTFVGNNLHVQTTAVSNDHEVAAVDKFTFEKVSSLNDVTVGECRISVVDGVVSIQGLEPSQEVSVADIRGRIVARVGADSMGVAVLSIRDMAQGVYIVTVADGKSFKLYQK